MADAARETIQRDYSEERIAELVRQRLAIIGERHRFDEFKRDVKALVAAYRDLVRDIRDVVGRVVPAGGDVMVVSKGDHNLLQFEGRTGCHFPETDTGVYAGYHPARQRRRDRGARSGDRPGHQYLLFPGTSLWWLDHYDGFRAHLDARYPRLWSDRQCVLYDVRRPGAPAVRRMSTVLVASVIATKCRNGGNARAVLNWVHGLRKLGVQAYYVEQIASQHCIDDRGQTVPFAESANVAYFEHVMREAGLTGTRRPHLRRRARDPRPRVSRAAGRRRKRRTCC